MKRFQWYYMLFFIFLMEDLLSVLLLLNSYRVALRYSQFKVIFTYVLLSLGVASQFILC